MPLIELVQVVSVVAVVATLVAVVMELRLQNRFLKAQALRDQFDMYRWTYEPITDEHVRELVLDPESYLTRERYEADYEGRPDRIRRYLKSSIIYEYLAFQEAHERMGLPNPFGKGWVEGWTEAMLEQTEFLHACEQAGESYTHYYRVLESVGYTPPSEEGPAEQE